MSIYLETRYSNHPNDVQKYGTKELRDHFLVSNLFEPNKIKGVYSLNDRLIVGGICASDRPLPLTSADQLKSDYFLERREMGIINIGGDTVIEVDGTIFQLSYKEALYIGKGARNIIFHPANNGESQLYFNSAPAHCTYPTQKVGKEDAEVVTLGSLENSNHRTIYKLLVNSVVKTCQLQMGMTELRPGSVWNTMPAHTHDRRMEAYFYFEVQPEHAVCHYMGQPEETRHIWVKNKQAIICPPWSIHSGAGTSNYTFIWGMAGENLDYGDMDMIAVQDLK